MLINNRNAWPADPSRPARQDDLRGSHFRVMPVLKDLIVDMSGFFSAVPIREPYLKHEQPEPSASGSRSKDRAGFDDTTKCILCAACKFLPLVWARPE